METLTGAVPHVAQIYDTVFRQYPKIDPGRLIQEVVRRLIDAMVNDVLAETRRRIREADPISAAAIRALPHPVVAFSPAMVQKDRDIKSFLFEHMYRHPSVTRETEAARQIVRELFEGFMDAPERLPEPWRRLTDGPATAGTARVVADYIAGMTDRYAKRAHRQLTGREGSGGMNLFRDMRGRLLDALQALVAEGKLPDGLETARVAVEPPRDASHGDMAVNAAMVLAKDARMKPRDLAGAAGGKAAGGARRRLGRRSPGRASSTSGSMRPSGMAASARSWRKASRFGRSDAGKGEKVNVEYVSANPTGPLHIGHARGAVFGDVLASLLDAAGYDVCREFYINDAGAQVDILARSAYLRYREALGEAIGTIPEGLYPGDYLKEVGKALAAADGDRWMTADGGGLAAARARLSRSTR